MNLRARVRCSVVGVLIVCVIAASPSFAETDDEYLLQMQQLVTRGETGVGLFPIQVPGETFAAERSQIGHQVSDFTLRGNGLAAFDLVRKFQESPAAAPYSFGNMSIEVPMLTFRVNVDGRNDQAFNMSCTHLSATGIAGKDWLVNPNVAVTELYNDVQFTTAATRIELLPRALVNSAILSNYPGDALLVSKDNYYLKCNGPYYVLYAPDGTSYHFGASADKIISSTTTTNYQDQETVTPFRTYRIRATTIKRHNSTINLTYEALPDVVVARPANNYSEIRDARAHTPIAATRYNVIESPRRLKNVVLIAAHDTDPGKPEFHTLDIEYFPNSGTNCPGLINNIRQTYQSEPSAGISLVHQKRYTYRMLNYVEQSLVAAPRSGCLLSAVEQADERDNGVFNELWHFTYGNYDGTVNGLVVTGRGEYHTDSRGPWSTYTLLAHTYIPLREVVTPTSSRVVYEYTPLRPCHYQTYHNVTTDHRCDKSNSFVNAVSKRTVHYQSEGLSKSQQTTFETVRANADEYQTWIKNEKTRHRLLFGRSFPTVEQPDSSQSLNSTDNARYLKAGRLLKHEMGRVTDALATVLIRTTFDYKENGIFPATHVSRPWIGYRRPDDQWFGDQGWGWKNARQAYLATHRRINRYKTTTEIDGNTYIKEVKPHSGHPEGFDAYNQPLNLTERYTLRTSAMGSRTSSYFYDHDYAGKYGWYVALPAETRRHSGTDALVSARTYNLSGLVSSTIEAGITTQYQYHLNGNLKASINGNGHATNYTQYKHGVPTVIASPENGLTTRVVDARGHITQENIRKEGSQYNTTNYEYNDPFSRLSLIRHPDGVTPTAITYPNWRAASTQWRKSVTRGRQQTITHYDSLGREDYAGTVDLSVNYRRYVNTVYDQLGRVVRKSDPATNGTSQTGQVFTHDDLGRVTSARHSSDPSTVGSTLYCYGSDCADSRHNGNFNGAGAGTVKDGYAVRDPEGAVTVYNFRAFGAPENVELMEIRQQIMPASGYVFTDPVLVTRIERNPAGIVTRISQGPGDNPSSWLHRDYEPYKVNGSLTHLTQKETHPEFDGSRTVTAFDGVGNPTSVVNFDGSTHTYTYDDRERLVYHQTPGNTTDIDSAGTLGYTYYDNNTLRTISSGGSVWTYDYTANNRLAQGTLSFAGESFSFGYQYDNELNLSQINYPSAQAVAYSSNGFGQPVSAGAYVSSATYYPNGYLASMTVGSGETYSNSLDARKRVSQITVQNPNATGNAMQPLELDYGYTDRGNVASIAGYFNRGNSQTVSLSNLQYDGLSRLHQATGFWGSGNAAANFSYDPWGNIDKRHVGGVNLGYQYDAVSKQLLSATFSGDVGLNYNRSFSYDGNGNVTSDGVKTYRYDHLNRLVRADTDGTTIQTNSYDGHGHRIRTIVNDGQRNRTTFFIYDPSGTLLHEYDQESGEQRDHIQFNGRSIATRSFHQDHDSDGDGLPDYFERTFGLPIFDASNADDDSDNDGLSDLVEYQLGLIPTSSDSDGDGISDGDEYPTYVTSSSSGTPGSAGRTLDPVFDYLNDL